MQRHKESFIEGISFLMISQIIIKILGMIYSLYLTNKKGFGDKGNALCMSGFQIYALFLGLCSIGVPNVISKMISENIEIDNNANCKRIIKSSLVIFMLISSFLCFILYYGANFIANKILLIEECSDILKVLAPSIVFSTLESVFRGYFNGVNNISISAKSTTIEQILKMVITIIAVEITGRLTNSNTVLMAEMAMISASIATIFSFLYSFFKFREINNKSGIKVSKKNVKSIRIILKELFYLLIPVSMTSMFLILGNNIDSITIVRILKDKVGENQAQKVYGIIISKVNLLINLPLALNSAISMSVIPEISRSYIKNNILKIENSINFSFLITLIISIPITIVFLIYSESIMLFLYPNAPDGANLLKLGAVTIIFSCLTQNISGILQGIGNSKTHLYSVIFGTFLKVILNYILISNELIMENGAIISNIICDFFIFIIMYRKFKKSFNSIRLKLYSNFIKIFFIWIVSFFISKLIFKSIILFNLKIKFIFEIIVTGIIYLILIKFLKIAKEV